jgi:hypothetical protein
MTDLPHLAARLTTCPRNRKQATYRRRVEEFINQIKVLGFGARPGRLPHHTWKVIDWMYEGLN